MADARQSPPLQGNPLDVINRTGLFLILGVLLCILLGVLVDRLLSVKMKRQTREPVWVKLLLLVSYVYLIPGLFLVLFSFNALIDLGPNSKIGLGPNGGMGKFPGTTESMLGVISMTYRTGSVWGAAIVVLYAMAIPALKLILLFLGNFTQHREDWQKFSRRCIQCVQHISKWACPDMFAYILLMHLVQSLDTDKSLRAAGHLDLGFTCFSLFCVGSTIASLGIRVPDREHGCWQKAGRFLGRKGLLCVVAPLTIAFSVLFVFGMGETAMALDLSHMDPARKAVLDSLGLSDSLNARVSFWECMVGLLHHVRQGEVNSLLGLIMMGVFMMGFTVLDMALLLVSAFLLKFGKTFSHRWMHVAWVAKKLSMLDVAIMGVFVVTLVLVMYKDDGVQVTTGRGLYLLLAAEVIHYITYYLVKGTVECVVPELCLGNPVNEDEDEAEKELGSGGGAEGDSELGSSDTTITRL
ncbi:unnamed protein product [Polarella glacialis]|uniref:Uncharacterized protein n=1 Tax=Polarella glacialis TaxID=89957 RepID=A0A813JVK0_POLGL|nr:unnamed protein product [Polarella glacialis]